MIRRAILWMAVFAVASAGNYAAPLDEPLTFRSVKDFMAYARGAAPDSIHPELRTALSYILTQSDQFGDPQQQDERLLAFVNGETPRRLILWGFRVRVERLQKAVLEEKLLIAKRERLGDESFEESEKLYRHRLSEEEGWIIFCQRVIDQLTKPNSESSVTQQPTQDSG